MYCAVGESFIWRSISIGVLVYYEQDEKAKDLHFPFI